MTPGEFFGTFDDATRKKLEIFRSYAREWLPVFLVSKKPMCRRVCLFDFFAGQGCDDAGVPGSPLILLEELRRYGSRTVEGVSSEVHFTDKNGLNVRQLRANIESRGFELPPGSRVEALEFGDAFRESLPTLRARDTAKLVLLDQFGVGLVTDDVFAELVRAPFCDFIFFISSSTLHRFRDHPAIKQELGPVDDYHSVHRAVLEYFRSLLPDNLEYYLAPFSFKKGSNIYGLIFGSGHLLGIDKFLSVAWAQDESTGEANFDITETAFATTPICFSVSWTTGRRRSVRSKTSSRLRCVDAGIGTNSTCSRRASKTDFAELTQDGYSRSSSAKA